MKTTTKTEVLNVLLIGNNPIDMGVILDKLNSIRNKNVVTEIAFDYKTVSDRIVHFTPSCILIDDNIGKAEMALIADCLIATRKTKDVPITVLKNSNYAEVFVSAFKLDYVLKQNWSIDSMLIALKNSPKFLKTQHYLQQA